MNKYIVGLAIAIGLSMSQVNATEALPSVCESTWTLAYHTMKLRQDNTPKETVESVIHSDYGQAIVDEAYRKSIVPEQMRLTVSKSFANHKKLECEHNEIRKKLADQ